MKAHSPRKDAHLINGIESHHPTCYHYHGDCAAARIQKALGFIETIWKVAPPEVVKIKQLLEGKK